MPDVQPVDPIENDFSIRIRTRGHVLLIQLEGALVGTPVDIVRTYVTSTLATLVPLVAVADVSALTMMDDAGLDILRSATRQARNAGGRFVVTGGHHLLNISAAGLDLAPTVTEAFTRLDDSGEHARN
ncbi:STAS domain-containing protein [Nonomuraea sp. NPDC050643]|uniref:STAS domain-containing protein n=1 Tax=Nonomuraea sp. NPDC050643 TaxID=3155660 RepID=UPI0033CB0A17